MRVDTERKLKVEYGDGGIVLTVKNGSLRAVEWIPAHHLSSIPNLSSIPTSNLIPNSVSDELLLMFNFLRNHQGDFTALIEKLEELMEVW